MSVQAVILAAGKGSRLYPLTKTRSKAMLPILGKPMVERVMEDLENNGGNDFILVIHPDDQGIIRHFDQDSQRQAKIRFVYQSQQLGMADALRCAAPLIEGDFILSACDNLMPEEYIAQMLKQWQTEPRPNALLTLMEIDPEKIGSSGIVAQKGGWVTKIIEKPTPTEAPSNIASLPLYCLPYTILEYLAEITPSARGEYELQDAIQMLIERCGRVLGIQAETRYTLTRPADLLAINKHYLSKKNQAYQLPYQKIGDGTLLIEPLYIESGTKIGNNCKIGPDVYIEKGCQIGNNVHIQDAVVLGPASIADGANISDQIIF